MDFIDYNAPSNSFGISLRYRESDGGTFRRIVMPDDSIADLPAETQDKIRAFWETLGGLIVWEATVRPPALPITPSEVKDEGLRRILAAMESADYEDRGAMALTYLTGNAAKKTEVAALYQKLKAIKAAGIALAVQVPIPTDYTADKHWPA